MINEKQITVALQDPNVIINQVVPQEDNNNNTNMIVSYELHLHSTMYLILHTAVGSLGFYDKRAFYFELNHIEIEDEEGYKLIIE